MKQYFIKVIRDNKGQLVYFNFGMDKHRKYKNTCISLSDIEYICITCYEPTEWDEYNETVQNYLKDSKAKLSIHI